MSAFMGIRLVVIRLLLATAATIIIILLHLIILPVTIMHIGLAVSIFCIICRMIIVSRTFIRLINLALLATWSS